MASTGEVAQAGHRYDELDSMRGLAALSVLLGHALLMFPAGERLVVNQSAPWPLEVLAHSPLSAMFAGHQAVLFFFLHSGFVLALPFLSDGSSPTFWRFALRRVCRIYIPFAAAIAFALLARSALAGQELGATEWLKGMWPAPADVWAHLTLVGWFDPSDSNPVVWSLIHEMRISLLFPLLMWVVVRCRWQVTLAGFGGLSMIATAVVPYWDRGGVVSTASYVLLFAAGALMAKHRGAIFGAAAALRSNWRAFGVVAALALYTARFWFWPSVVFDSTGFLQLLATGLGAALLLVAAVTMPTWGTVLRHSVPRFLGRISYSLYLVHAVVFIAAGRLFGSTPLVVAAAVVVSFMLAWLTWRYVERPSIALGRRVARQNVVAVMTRRANEPVPAEAEYLSVKVVLPAARPVYRNVPEVD